MAGRMKLSAASCAAMAAAGLSGCATVGAPAAPRFADCGAPSAMAAEARAQAEVLYARPAAPFGRTESGWAVYAPAATVEIGAACPPGTAAFAEALARWQGVRGLTPSGSMDAPTLQAMIARWQARRPFLAVRAAGICPDPPPPDALVTARPDETAGRPVQVRRRALKAYRRLRGAARRALPEIADDRQLLRIFSAFRSPAYDDERCAREANCDGVARAPCSAHRTGLAFDLMVGAVPGGAVDSTGDANRQAQVRGLAYRWLVANAPRYGFVNYPFEPWHWEWIGEPIVRPSF